MSEKMDVFCYQCRESAQDDNGVCSYCGSEKIIPVDELIDSTMAIMENR